jgi:aspartyl-tRNA(Asn)/glutamyl-tRNA(Gln) amidotransferase subunit A
MGAFARSTEDLAAVLQVIAGHDPADGTSAPVAVPDYAEALNGSAAGMRVGLPEEYFGEGLDPHIRAQLEGLVEWLKGAGAVVQPVSLPHTPYGIATYYVLATAEASSNLARYDGIRYGYRADLQGVKHKMAEERKVLQGALAEAEAGGPAERAAELHDQLSQQESLLHRLYAQTRTEGFGPEVKRRIMLGTYVLSSGYYDAYYARAQRVRSLIRRDFDEAFKEIDLLLTPAVPTPAFELGSKVDDPLAMYLSDIYTVTANLAGIPGLVVPIGTHPSGLPVGAQLLGPPFQEARLLQAGRAVMARSA